MLKLLLCCALFAGTYAFNHGDDLAAFEAFRVKYAKYNKDYATAADKNNANYYFNYHTKLVAQQNALEERKASSYRVEINQFSDIRLITFAARLPKAVYPATNNAKAPPPISNVAADEFNILTEYTLDIKAQDQYTTCSGSWAYAAVKATQILNALPNNANPIEYSAQQLIDCAGMSTSCTTQVPQKAFDYLTMVTTTKLVPETAYPPIPDRTQGMCTPAAASANDIKPTSYSMITDNDDETLKRYISSSIPVIIEYNPATHGFMQYKSGVYVPTTAKAESSQFLVVVGYGHDTTYNLDYWLCLNSFGPDWGENGSIRIVRNAKTYPISKRAIFPNL